MIGLGFLLFGPRLADACVIAAAPGASVSCLSEEALIVWNSRSHQQELIRSINVQSHAADFAYLTALPSLPIIRPVHQDLFLRAYTLTKPKVSTIHQTRIQWRYFFHDPDPVKLKSEEAASLSSGIIAQSDHVIFSSLQLAAVESWFHENRYAYTSSLQKWVTAAMEKNWFVVLSRVERPKSAGSDSRLRVRTSQMSFQTPQPIYPYRENGPAFHPLGLPRPLRLYVISDEQLQGGLKGETWRADMVFSNKRNDLRSQLGSFFETEEDVPSFGWLSLFTEKNTYRSSEDDIQFLPIDKPKTVARKPQKVDEVRWIILPLDIVLGCIITLIGLRLWFKK